MAEERQRKYLLLIALGPGWISSDVIVSHGDYYVAKRELETLLTGIKGITPTHIFTSPLYDTMAYLLDSLHEAKKLRELFVGPNTFPILKRNPNVRLPELVDGTASFIIAELGEDGDSSNFRTRECQDPVALLKIRI